MSETPGSDPLLDPLVIAFDTTLPVISDCKVYTVPYTVTFKDYPLNVENTGSFIFTLTDACGGATVTAQTFTFPSQVF